MSTVSTSSDRTPLLAWLGELRAVFGRASQSILAIYVAALVVFGFLVTPIRVIGGDSPSLAYLPISILQWGSLNLDPFINRDPLFDLSRQPHYVVFSNGHYYSKFSPVPSLLALPVYAPYVWLGGELQGRIYLFLSWIVAILIAAVTTALLFATLQRLVSRWQALLLALIYAFSTYTWFAASHTIASQSSGELFLMLAAWLLIRSEENGERTGDRRAGIYALAGLSVGLAVAARLNTVLVALVLSAYVFQRAKHNKAELGSYLLGGGVVALLLGAYNSYAFGSPLSTGYGAEANDWTTPIWVGLPGILISPGHGLLMYSPPLLLSAAGMWLVWRQPLDVGSTTQCPYCLLGRYLSIACLLQLLLMSHWWAWHGGNAYGQRMLQEVHPFLILLVGFALRRYRTSRLFVVLLIGGALWAFQLNVARTAFYQPWAEAYRSDLVWSLRNAEIMTYIRQQGLVGFVAGMAQTLLRICAAAALPSVLVWLLSARRNRAPVDVT